MAENDGQSVSFESTTPEQVLAAGGVSKRRRNLSSKAGERIRNPHSKSPKRRAGTPEPERRIYTDESEKDISDSDRKADGSKTEDADKQKTAVRSRMLARSKEHAETIRRTRSAERPPKKDITTEIEDDFEIIRRMHKTKELEEEVKETEKLKADTKPRVKEEPKEFVLKDMPPLIMAPTELRKRLRPKTLQLQKSLSEDDQPRTAPRTKSKTRITKRKVSTSEEEEESSSLAVKGKLTLKPKPKEQPIKAEPRTKKIVKKQASTEKPLREKSATREKSAERKEISEPEEVGDDKEVEAEAEEEEELEEGEEEEEPKSEKKPWFFQRWFSWGKKPVEEEAPKTEVEEEVQKEVEIDDEPVEEEEEAAVEETVQVQEKEPEVEVEAKKPEPEKPSRRWLISETFSEWRIYVGEHGEEYDRIMRLRNNCISSLILLLIYCGFGGMIFRFTEGAFESFYKCGVKRVKRDFIDSLWSNSQYMLEEDWKSQARRKLMEFENQLHTAHEAGMTTYSGQRSWSFLNAVVYCLTVVTTIGYGHISPSTATGRAITIIYAIFGIPMFLILLADFGKLFTRCIKFLWAFVRRLYYTGSCKKVRKTVPMQEMMKGVQLVYDFAKNRRPSQMPPEGEDAEQQTHLKPPEVPADPDTPATPALSSFEVDDEFNLPISVAITILLIYIFFGATIYWTWEEWSFFESFYFVFISMSTIGFGDFVPQHPMYMMASIVYLIFGLALTSMCINVVQEKLSDTFRQASVKIGATIGLRVLEDDGTAATAPAELADVNPDNQSDNAQK